MCPPSLLRGAFGLGHGAVVEQRPKNPADDRTKDVEPETREIPRNDHRSQRASLFEPPPVTGPAMNTPTAKVKPTAMGAIAAGAL